MSCLSMVLLLALIQTALQYIHAMHTLLGCVAPVGTDLQHSSGWQQQHVSALNMFGVMCSVVWSGYKYCYYFLNELNIVL